MISHKHKCIFVHIPKCGGQSIEQCFMQDYGILNRKTRECYDKLNIDPWMENTPKEMLNSHWLLSEYPKLDYFKFAIIRNPMDRAISYFQWFSQKYADYSFEEFCKTALSTKNKWEFMMTRPQVDYLEGGVDKILRLGEHAPFFKEKYGFTVPHINKSKKREIKLTDESRDIISKKYKEDFKLWRDTQ